jgi:hypothetical protein
MDFVLKFRTVIDFYTTVLCLWWLKRRYDLKWKSEKELFSSDFL